MKMKRVLALLMVACMLFALLSACATDSPAADPPATDGAAANGADDDASGGGGDAPAAGEDMEVDLSDVVEITMYSSGWVNQPFPEDDPFREFVLDHFNIDLQLIIVPDGDMPQRVFAAVAAGNDPDFLYFRHKPLMQQLHEQGVLVQDHAIFLDRLPNIMSFTTDLMLTAVTYYGEMFALPRRAEAANYSAFLVRQDYLDALGLDIPETSEDMLNLFRALTFDDPTGTGDTTFGMGAAGNNAGLGGMWNLRFMFGPTGFFIEDNELRHDRFEESFVEFLDFMRIAYSEGIIDPDFYIMTGEAFDAALYGGRYGVTFGQPLLALWMENATGMTGRYIDVWTPIPAPAGPSGRGGRYPEVPPVGGFYGIFDMATEDPIKLERLLYFIDQSQYPSEAYWALRWGIGIYDTAVVTPFADGALFFPQAGDPRAMAGSLWDYGCWIGTAIDRVKYSPGAYPTELDYNVAYNESITVQFDRFMSLDFLISFDAGRVENFTLATEEFAFQYITGQTDDIDGFRERLNAMGWQDYMDSAREQLRAVGLLD